MKHATSLLLALLAIALPTAVRATNYYWTGAIDSDFTNPANWSGRSVPPSSSYDHNIVLDDTYLTGNTVKTVSLPGNNFNIAKMTVNSTGWTCTGNTLFPLEGGFYATSPDGTNIVFQKEVKATSRTFSVVAGGTVVFAANPYLDGSVTWNMTGGGTFVLASGTSFGGWSGSRAVKLADGTVLRVGCGNPYSNTASGTTTWAGGTVTLQAAMSRLQLKNTLSAAQTFIDNGKIVNGYDTTNYNLAARDIGDGYVEVYLAFAGTPEITASSLSKDANGAFAVSATLGTVSATLTAYADDGVNAPVATLLGTDVAGAGTASATLSGLSSDTTYSVYAVAENAAGAVTNNLGAIYNGVPQIAGVSDALELGLVPGTGTVSRAAAAAYPLTVNLAYAGTAGAVEGQTYATPAATVTIPAGAASAPFEIVPLSDASLTVDSSVVATVAAGDTYLSATPMPSAAIGIRNSALPTDRNVWIASSDGLASDGDNWSQGAPTTSSDIPFDGTFSTARCIWDADATHTVASWTQNANFTGTVEFQTTYENGPFPVFAIAGDCTVNGGKWTQTANSNAQVYRLSATVGGNWTVGTGATITATGKGYSSGNFPSGSACGVHGGSVDDLSKVYGNLKHPVDIGSGGASNGLTGGGAIHLVVTGNATINGTVAAQPSQGAGNNQHGAGGSIYLQAASVDGTGTISAAGYGSGGWTLRPDGAGGRVAIVLTTATTLGLPAANLRCNGTTAGYGRSSGGGTIFVKTAAQQNGTLYVVNNFDNFVSATYWPTKRGVTPIPAGQTWTLDEIVFRGVGVLCVPDGTTLEVPVDGVSATAERTGGILYEGGTIDFGTAPYALSGNWVFQADVPFTFNGDVTVAGGASIGCLRFSGSILDGSNENGAKWDDFAVCDVTVDGDLTIASGGYASAELGGPCGNAGTGGRGDGGDFYPRHGGQYAPLSGNHCYGSVFDPVLPGQFAQCGDHATIGVGGGALKLTVTGDLVVDGRITADGVIRSKSSAPAGSINIRANTLLGTGSISATGNKADAVGWGDPSYHGVGGRIAVRVTGEDVGTTGVWTKFAARGCATNQVNTTNERNQNSSAGTVYLQGASDGEKGGTIFVKNQKSYDTSNVATWLPAGTLGDAAADFKKAKLVIADRGVVAIDAPTFRLASVSIEANSRLDLHGNKVVVADAFLAGEKCPYGTFTASSSDVAGYVFDSVGGGTFVVAGQGTVLIVK